jgi:hypothetical protein
LSNLKKSSAPKDNIAQGSPASELSVTDIVLKAKKVEFEELAEPDEVPLSAIICSASSVTTQSATTRNHTMYANLLKRGVLPCLLATAIATSAWAQADFVAHPTAPGPKRLEVEKADNSGKMSTDIQFITDRLAILNHLSAYAFLFDEGRLDDWFDLFSDDVTFEATTPTLGTVIIHGKKAFKEMVDVRYAPKEVIPVRRHTMGNIHLASQTPTTAQARTYMLISTVPAGDKLDVLTTGTYNANLEKRDGRWVITRWYIEADAPLAASKLPQGYPESVVKFIPDPRAAAPAPFN